MPDHPVQEQRHEPFRVYSLTAPGSPNVAPVASMVSDHISVIPDADIFGNGTLSAAFEVLGQSSPSLSVPPAPSPAPSDWQPEVFSM